jgi:excisionase family DNA binding protein
MRYVLKVTRVQSAERSVSATDVEAAMQKIQDEIERPYGFLGGWKTEGVEIEVISAESRIGGASVDDGGGSDDPFLFSVKGAAKKLGVSVNTLYTLINSGEIEHVRVGKRILISRAGLTKFIEVNSRVGRQS